jgi:surfeit locus 1 family protein
MTRSGKPLLWPGLMTLAMLVVLVGLGTWQLQRLAWKEALLARLAERMTAPPADWPTDLPSAGALDRGKAGAAANTLAPALAARVEAWEFRPVRLRCMPDPKISHVGAGRTAQGDAPSWSYVLLCRPAQGAPVLVDVGANPPARSALLLPEAPVAELVVEGRTKPASTTLEAVRAMGADPVPLVVVAQTPWPGLVPSRQPDLEGIPNNHLTYAFTWYGLAATLVGVFGVYAFTSRARG